MTNEEIEKRIEFIIEHQAHLTAKVDELATIQAESEVRLNRVEDSFVLLVQMAKITDSRLDTLTQNVETLTANVEGLVGIVDALTGNIDALIRNVDALENKVNALAEKVTALTDAQKNTDERLNNLIDVVERYISERRNGKS